VRGSCRRMFQVPSQPYFWIQEVKDLRAVALERALLQGRVVVCMSRSAKQKKRAAVICGWDGCGMGVGCQGKSCLEVFGARRGMREDISLGGRIDGRDSPPSTGRINHVRATESEAIPVAARDMIAMLLSLGCPIAPYLLLSSFSTGECIILNTSSRFLTISWPLNRSRTLADFGTRLSNCHTTPQTHTIQTIAIYCGRDCIVSLSLLLGK